MPSFLETVAQHILTKHGTNLADIAVVFPNKRASLFLNEHLARLASGPIWSPAYLTISDLFRQQSQRTVADPIKLVCDLYKSFTAQTGIDETLDHFYGWGQTLLTDFDDIDKNMADADKVFANLRDIHEFDSVSYLTDEQKAIIRKFFSNFSPDHNSQLKERFLRLWSHMGDIYHDFNQRIAWQGLAYEGALYREVVERLTGRREFAIPDPSPSAGGDLPSPTLHSLYLFVGFNLLLPVEQQLFSYLRREGRARFYWDFDRYYMNGHEAGHYISRQLADFPNELDNDDDLIYNQFSKPKHIKLISAPTENIQARYVTNWLSDLLPPSSFLLPPSSSVQSAIVLCNENLLQTVIHCLPQQVGKVNITTGYPLMQAPVASLIMQLINLRTTGYSTQREAFRLRQVNAVLRHPYINTLSPAIPQLLGQLNDAHIYYPTPAQLCVDPPTSLLFSPLPSVGGDSTVGGDLPLGSAASLVEESPTPTARHLSWLCAIMQLVARSTATDDPLFQESVFRAYTLLNRLLTLTLSGDLLIDVVTMQKLITQLIQTSSIPFHGEPVEGLQVMGMLETRNLDFRHLLLLSCNEGNMPRGINDASFIPHNIRKAFQLTTVDQKTATYSYYFHRLLQRAEDVTIVYNNATTDGQRGEMSRFLLQLMVESPHTITFGTLHAAQQHTPFTPPTIVKTPAMIVHLMQRFTPQQSPYVAMPSPPAPSAALSSDGPDSVAPSPLLTPTALNRYQRCPLIFYYTYICNLREPDPNSDDDTIDNRIFGNIFHEAARIVYTHLMQKSQQILAADITHLLNTRVDIERAVDQAIQQELFHAPATHPSLNGLQIINREVIIHYLRQLLVVDRQLAPFTIIGLECDVLSPFTVPFPPSVPVCGDVIATSPIAPSPLTPVIGGRIDRLDRITDASGNQRIRVIDYKTGSFRVTPLADVDAIFDPANLKLHNDYYLQTLLYASLVRQQYPTTPVAPALLFIQHAAAADYDPTLSFADGRIVDVAPHIPRFNELLRALIADIFSPDVPFVPTNDRTRCPACPYRRLCSLYRQ